MKYFLFLCTLLLACGCNNTKTQKSATGATQPAATQSAAADTLLPDSLFFMLQDEPLPQHVDTTQDISRLSYGCLRLLRSYVYAIHGHWFMEGELNKFFGNHTQWYDSLSYYTWCEYAADTVPQKVLDYNTALTEDYPRAYGMIELTAGERAFVERIDSRMKELEADRHVASAGGVELLNPVMTVNLFQVLHPGTGFTDRLREHNIALQPTRYLQLFNTYEINDYHGIPSFVTTDLMLQAFHIYFSFVLKSLESDLMMKSVREALWQMLLGSYERLCVCPDQRICYDMDNAVYCLVGMKLLGYDLLGTDSLDSNELEYLSDWLAGPCMEEYRREVELTEAAQDAPSPFFRTEGQFPYSLFKPRGHYTRNERSQRYFRAMMWLQKGCFKRDDRMQLEHAVSLASLINDTPKAQKHLRRVDQALSFLLGTPDNVSILDLATYMREQGFMGNDIVLNNEAMAQIDKWLQEQFKMHNRIRPKEQNGPQDELNLLPGRYTMDGEILGTIYDPRRDAPRAYPSGLDVMDVLGVETATELLQERNSQQPWADYEKERKAQADRVKKFSGWDNTVYSKWIHTLVRLQQPDKRQPPFMQTGAWRLKNLNTALASWALLKHDAVLYSEQPMAAECGGAGLPTPEMPGYVEPNLAFWQELESMLSLTRDMLERTGFMTERIKDATEQLAWKVEFCRKATEAELAGKPLSTDDYETIRRIGSTMEWFTLSIIDPDEVYLKWDDIKGADRCVAQVSDVFTRNITGCTKDGILYEAAGLPNDIYVLVEIKGNTYLMRGSVYSYHEFVRPLGDRLTDEQWQEMLFQKKAPGVPEWFAPLLMDGEPVSADERYIYATGC